MKPGFGKIQPAVIGTNWSNLSVVFTQDINNATQTLLHSFDDKRVILEGTTVRYSENNGTSYNTGVDMSSLFTPIAARILANGNIVLFSGKTKVYYSDDNLSTVKECTVLDKNGNPYVYHTPVNPANPGGYWKFMGGFVEYNGISVVGTYTNSAYGASPVQLYYSLNGITWKVFYTFGQAANHTDDGTIAGGTGGTLLGDPTNPLIARHIHAVNIGGDGSFYVGTGDSVNEEHFLKCTYNYSADTWTVVDLLSGASLSSQKMRTLGVYEHNGYIYWGVDSAEYGIYKCRPDELNDFSKHILVQAVNDAFYSFVRCGNIVIGGFWTNQQQVIISTDYGETWRAFNKPSYWTSPIEGAWYNKKHKFFGSNFNSIIEIKNKIVPNATPYSVAALLNGSTIDLTCVSYSTDEDGYCWEKSNNGTSGWVEIGRTGSGVKTFSDSSFTIGNTYYYRVRSFKGSKFSSYCPVTSILLDPVTLTLSSTGNGTGVATLRMISSADVMISLGANAKFYSDAAGTLNESSSWKVVGGGTYKTIYLKCTTGTATFTINSNKITSWGSLPNTAGWTSSTNAPSIGGDISNLTALTFMFISGSNNTLTGDIGRLTSLTYFTCAGSNTMYGDVSNLTSLTRLYVEGSNTVTGDISQHTSLTYIYLKGSNTITANLRNVSDGLTYCLMNPCRMVDYTAGGNWSSLAAASYVTISPSVGYGLSSAEVDLLLQEIASTKVASRAINVVLTGSNASRTAASNAAVATIIADGGSVSTN
ncbi:MAG TPA: hypothetical protein VK153_01520 [Candidatus Paceibacterota bacterium]|nr:hypothetical protein [Candidatus Paceibacterota bacterium]